MITVQEMLKKEENINRMFDEARKGLKPICPKCKKGHVFNLGKWHFECDNPECAISWTIYIGKR